GGSFVAGGYNRTISSGFNSPIAGRQAWSANSGGFITTTISLPSAVTGQNIQLRWRAASDDSTGATGWYVDSVVLSNYVCVSLVMNVAPTLPDQTNRIIVEGSLLTVTNTASDPNLPADLLNYSLVSPPSGLNINASGIITWTPTEAQGPGIYTNTTIVTDAGGLSATNSFVITVTEVNQAPVLPVQTNRSIAELTLLTVTNTATDDDLPANALTYQLLNPPGNASISASGIITWTPGESEGPGSTNLTTVVSDGTVNVTNSFVVTIAEVNQAPVLPAQTNRTIAELTLLTVTNTATDGDLPANTLTYQLLNPPGNASISASGIITWMPGEAEGLGSTNLTTVVSDGTVNVTNSFVVTVTEVNQAPVLPVQTNRTIAELTLLTVTNTATDGDLPANPLTYQLLNPPGNASISANGIITWTPGESEGPGSTNLITVVSDGTSSVTNSFTVTVTEVNQAPVLPVQTNRSIAELTLLTVTNTATDGDLPANTLTYQLLNPPAAADINPSGVITWAPTEAQGPGVYTLTTVVNDGAVSVTNQFDVTVSEVNVAPVLPNQTNRTIAELTLLTVTNSATDDDLPANLLSYQLINPPGNAAINASGIITWTPQESEAPGGYTLTTVVSDGTVSVTNSFGVTVTEVNTAPTLNAIANRTIHAGGTVAFTATANDNDAPAQQLTFSLINSPPVGASINGNSGLFGWTTSSTDVNTTNTITVQVEDNGSPLLSDSKNFVVTVIARPQITNIVLTNGVAALTWNSIPGQAYRLQRADSLNPSNWQDVGSDVTAVTTSTTQTNAVPGVNLRFYRIRLAP
ncbi:MAG: Ig-like domain-containing protein, partial [Verrucomicrobiota bacterium]